MGWPKTRPCSPSTWTLWLEPTPSMKRPLEKWSTHADAMAMVGGVLTNTLVMLVPSSIFSVATAQAVSIENWSPSVSLGHPGGLVAQLLGQADALHDVPGRQAHGQCHSGTLHALTLRVS